MYIMPTNLYFFVFKYMIKFDHYTRESTARQWNNVTTDMKMSWRRVVSMFEMVLYDNVFCLDTCKVKMSCLKKLDSNHLILLIKVGC